MGDYNNNKYLKSEIMTQSRHLFVYGYTNANRTNFLQELENDYPLRLDTNKPVALYLNQFGLRAHEKTTNPLAEIIAREYLNMIITEKIIMKIRLLKNQEINNRIMKLFRLMSQERIEDLSDIQRQLHRSKETYIQMYSKVQEGLIDTISMSEIPIPFLQLEMVIKDLKEIMNIDSCFGIILDKKEPLSYNSTRSVNDLIGSRINKDLSIKVAIEPNDWETYIGNNGQYIEYPHDYGIVELDDSYQTYMKKLKKQQTKEAEI